MNNLFSNKQHLTLTRFFITFLSEELNNAYLIRHGFGSKTQRWHHQMLVSDEFDVLHRTHELIGLIGSARQYADTRRWKTFLTGSSQSSSHRGEIFSSLSCTLTDAAI